MDEIDSYSNPHSPIGLYESSLGIAAHTSKTMRSTYDYLCTLKRLRPSGEAFEYSSVDTQVLSWLCERVTGQSFPELISERIWRKLGAESDALLLVSSAGITDSHGCFQSTLRDMGRYGILFTPTWRTVSPERVISDASILRIQRGGRPTLFDKALFGKDIVNLFSDKPSHNTYQWDVVMGDGDFFKGGYGGQGLYISPARDLVIAAFGSGIGNESMEVLLFARAIAKEML